MRYEKQYIPVIKWKSANSFFDTREIIERIQSPKVKQSASTEMKNFRKISMVELNLGMGPTFIDGYFDNQPKFKYKAKKINNKKSLD